MFSISASDCSMGKAIMLRSASTHEIRAPVHVQSSGQAAPGLQSASSSSSRAQPKPQPAMLIPGSSPPDLRPPQSNARRERKTHAPASTLSRVSVYVKCAYSSPPLACVCLALSRMNDRNVGVKWRIRWAQIRRALGKCECWSEGARARWCAARLRGGDDDRRSFKRFIDYWQHVASLHPSRLKSDLKT